MHELTQNEMEKVSGGFWPTVMAGIYIVDALIDIYDGYQSAKEEAEKKSPPNPK